MTDMQQRTNPCPRCGSTLIHKLCGLEFAQVMKEVFPYYESDDRDDYVYLVRKEHILEAAQRIAKQDEAGWLIERGIGVSRLCLGFCERKWKWVTFTDIAAFRFARRSDAIRFIETTQEQFNWPEDIVVNEHLWTGGV